IPVRPGRNMWETNFVPDLAGFELKAWEQRGAGGSNMMFILADGTMHAHTSQMPVGTYKKAHRHGPDFHVFAVTGHGFSLLWYEGGKDFERIDWRHGWVFAPPDQMFHQHFNTAPHPARYLAVALGSLRYPFTTDKRRVFLGMDVSVKDGGCQIEYEHQDPRIHEIYLKELAKHGVTSGMGKFVDERPFSRTSASTTSGRAMHDLEFEHLHVSAEDAAVNEVAWAADNVELTTVGIDIGSSTSHLMFARVHLQRLSTALSSRFVVIERKILWQSPILLTPYRPDYTIDVDDLAGFIGGCYAYARVEREQVDSGAVILTGEALKRRNARAIADLFSEEAGKFVCASAGHHMECQMAAHGSGAVALSRGHNATLLNVD